MQWNDLLAAMARFGFTEKEARLYLLTLRRGRVTAADLARDAKMDRVLAYRTLDGMRSRGLVQVTAERPRRYVAIAPRVLFERSLIERRRALEEDVTLASELAKRLPELTESVAPGAPRFQVIVGTAAIYPYLREMVRRATRSIDVLISPRALKESARFGLYEGLPRFLREGGRFHLALQEDPAVTRLVQRYRRSIGKAGDSEIRSLPEQRARLTIVDEREALVFLVPEANLSTIDEIAVWTDNADFVKAQRSHFALTWNRGTPYGAPKRSR
jgi:sugar-specific transcriptional regulator TrmB